MLNKLHEDRMVDILREAGLGDESLQLAKVFIHIADEFPHQRKKYSAEEDDSNDIIKWGGLVVQSLGSGMGDIVGLGLYRKHCLKTVIILARAIMAIDRKLHNFR